jgi:hypothetical protein
MSILMSAQVARTLAIGAAVVGSLVLRIDLRERDLLLPLIALGLRREQGFVGRTYCIPVHSKTWGTIAGTLLTYKETPGPTSRSETSVRLPCCLSSGTSVATKKQEYGIFTVRMQPDLAVWTNIFKRGGE